VEAAYREYRLEDDFKRYEVAIRAIIPAFGSAVVLVAWKLGIHEVKPLAYLLWIGTILTLVATLLILKSGFLNGKNSTWFRVAVYLTGSFFVVANIYIARPERFLPLIGVLYSLIFIVNVQNSSFIFKAIITTMVTVFYIFLGIQRGFPVDGIFVLIVCSFSIFSMLALVHGYEVEVGNRREFVNDLLLEEERKKSESLLHNILPEPIARQLTSGDAREKLHVEKYESVSVLFADIVGFTGMSTRLDPTELVQTLNDLFSRFDVSVRHFGAEKIKTIGDAYMAVAGLPTRCDDHAERIVSLALEIRSAVDKYSRLMGRDIKIKIGIATGPVVAGIIGLNKFQYDLWGETVNKASRLETNGMADDILVCGETYKMLDAGKFHIGEAGSFDLKGIGLTRVWRITGHKPAVTELSA
jgi:class 3 adenylate cyclase